tara:strand:+ start:9665 stop:10135 length:471 start_codon:yes stop_codon:yes gene_type:complete
MNKKNLSCLFIAMLIFFFDRLSKIKIIELQIDNTQIFVNDYLNFDLVWNTGIGFGLLSSQNNFIYNLISVLIFLIILFIIYIILKSNFIDKILFGVILGGALGNFYDRVVYQAVPDFIDLHYQNFHWFTFNIADIFITLGIITIIYREIFFKNENK